MVKTREDYELETGLADDFDGVIADCFFEVNPQYSEISGTTDPMLTLVIESPDLEQPAETRYSCGGAKQWQIGRGGQEITSAKAPDSHRFNMNSRAGVLVSRLFTLVGNGNRAKGQDFFIARDRYMTEGTFYTGLNCHWKREPLKTVGGETRDVLMPDKYLGEVSSDKGVSRAAAGVAVAPTDDLDEIVVGMVAGKTDREVKMTAMKEDKLKGNDAYMKELISGPKLKQLEDAGKIGKGPDGKYI